MDEATNNLLFHVSSNSTGYWMAPAASLPDNTWTLVTGTYDGTSVKYYVNGTLQSGQSAAFTIGNYDGTNGLGVGDSYGSGREWKGYVDEARLSSTARSQDWITTEYNNQNSPSTFLSLSDAPGAGSNTTYAYDYRNRMTGTSGSSTSSYGYDVSGERVKAVLGGVTTLSPTRGYSLEGSTPTKQIYAGSTLVATVKGTGASATAYTVATDHLTGSNAVSTSAGALEELMDYYPYGSARLDEKTGSFNEKRKYAGHEYDGETGLNYMVARYYDGGVGRFYGQDQVFWSPGLKELVDPQRLNSYAYALNNPMRFIDPDGREPVTVVTLVIFGVVIWLSSSQPANAPVSPGCNQTVNCTSMVGPPAPNEQSAYPHDQTPGEMVTDLALAVVPVGGVVKVGSKIPGVKQAINETRKALQPYLGDVAGAVKGIIGKSRLSQEARQMFDYFESKGWKVGGTPKGVKGGQPWYNKGNQLPHSEKGYTEWDIPNPDGSRGSQRFVRNETTGKVYQTNDHYETFTIVNPSK